MGLKFNPLKVELEYQKKGSGGPTPIDDYVRPSEWPEIESLASSANNISLLVKIQDDGLGGASTAQVQLSGTGSPSGTIDWGDGNGPQSITFGFSMTCTYSYSNVNLISTSYGYKVAIIHISLSSGNITSFSHSALANQSPNILEVNINAPSLTSIDSATAFAHSQVQIFNLISSNLTNISSMLSNYISLRLVKNIQSNSNITNISNLFNNCSSIKTIYANFNPNNATNIASCFSGCNALIEISTSYTFDSALSYSSLFQSCSSLKKMHPLLGTVNNISNMFNGCSSLTEVQGIILNTGSQLSHNNSFANCWLLESISTTGVPANLSSNSSATMAFLNCYKLKAIPNLNPYKAAGGISFQQYLDGCFCLEEIPSFLNFGPSQGNISNFLRNTPSVKRCLTALPDANNVIPNSFGNSMSAAAIDEMFTNLPTVTGTKNISIAHMQGKAGATTSIATGKGWTVAT